MFTQILAPVLVTLLMTVSISAQACPAAPLSNNVYSFFGAD